MLAKAQINIRDPFVVPQEREKRYYMFGTRGPSCWGVDTGLDVYVSADLEHWDGPAEVFHKPADFWADRHFWAPEVHRYRDRWYMFASFMGPNVMRGTAILAADRLTGPFLPHSDGPVTPRDWMCLDGTLYVDAAGDPWIVYCHEWVQVHDGEIVAQRLSSDLRQTQGPTHLLFRATAVPWVKTIEYKPGFTGQVTDGPFLHRTASGCLLLLWSTMSPKGYALTVARSRSGEILGPWDQESAPLIDDDGGHGMLFRDFSGQLRLSIHRPNDRLKERPVFVPLREADDRLVR